jgi:hypothetical protein
MAKTVAVRFRNRHAAGGHDSGGSPVQGKVDIRGVVTVTSYSRGGESLTPIDLGLSTIDHLDLRVVEPVRSANPAQGTRSVVYSDAAQQFYLLEQNVGGGFDEAAGATAVTLSFSANGDAADHVELLP